MEPAVERYYYSSHHLARDVIGAAAPFTLFLLTLITISPEIRIARKQVFAAVPQPVSWSVVGIASIIYLLVAFVIGILVNRAVLLIRRVPFLRRFSLDLRRFYDANSSSIAAWYRTHVHDCAELTSNPADNSAQYVDRLIGLLRLYNPAGYSHIYREYMFMFIYRQCIAYALLIEAFLIYQLRWWLVAGGWRIHHDGRDWPLRNGGAARCRASRVQFHCCDTHDARERRTSRQCARRRWHWEG
jgi:hypothetical protein